MTQFSMLPWATGVSGDGAAPYTQEQSNNFFRFFDVRDPAGEGIALGVMNELAVSGTSTPLSVATGAAICYGRYWNDSSVSLSVTTPTVGTTGGRVVVRFTWATRLIRLAVRMSTNGISAIPALVQTFGNTWEISLATFTITTGGVITLTDDRTYRKVTAQVDTAALINNAVTTAKIANGNVTTEKIADLNVTTEKIANDAIDDAKVGNRVPQFYRRRGGSGTNWSTQGVTNYTPTAVRMQGGVVNITAGNGFETPFFPVAFSNPPLVFVSPKGTNHIASVGESLADRVTILLRDHNNGFVSGDVYWLAIGPE